jgi:hypothetical protein
MRSFLFEVKFERARMSRPSSVSTAAIAAAIGGDLQIDENRTVRRNRLPDGQRRSSRPKSHWPSRTKNHVEMSDRLEEAAVGTIDRAIVMSESIRLLRLLRKHFPARAAGKSRPRSGIRFTVGASRPAASRSSRRPRGHRRRDSSLRPGRSNRPGLPGQANRPDRNPPGRCRTGPRSPSDRN